MKLKTLQDLQNALDNEYAWRIREITHLKTLVRESTGPKRSTAIRSGIPLLYAHWEGFVKKAGEALVNYVANQRCTYGELIPCYVVRGIRGELASFVKDQRYHRQIRAVEIMRDGWQQRARIPFRGVVDTGHNLSSKHFADIAVSIGIDPEPYATRAQFIDSSLLDRRNRIAHGEYLDIDDTGFIELANDVVELLRRFKNDVENFASQSMFRVGGDLDAIRATIV